MRFLAAAGLTSLALVALTAPAPAAPLRPLANVDWVTSDWERYVAYADGRRLTVLDTATIRRRTFRWREACSASAGFQARNAAAGRVLAWCGGPEHRLLDLRTGRLRRLPAGVGWGDGGLGRRLLVGSEPCDTALRCTVALDLRTWRVTRYDARVRLDVDRAPPRRVRVCPRLREHVLGTPALYEHRRTIRVLGGRRVALLDCRGRRRILARRRVRSLILRESAVSWTTGVGPPLGRRPRLHVFDARRGTRRSWRLPVTADPCPGDPDGPEFGEHVHTNHAVVWARVLPVPRRLPCDYGRLRVYVAPR